MNPPYYFYECDLNDNNNIINSNMLCSVQILYKSNKELSFD